MKKSLKSVMWVLATFALYLFPAFGQSPNSMSYQAVVRNSSDALITNTQIGMEINIRQGSVSGTVVYTETQTPTTNANGLVSIEIGNGANFTTIDWSAGPYFMETKTDPTGGTNYTITGTSQLLSVPYALHAKTAESVSGGITETDPVFNTSVAHGITATDTANWNKKLDSYTETDPVFSVSVANSITATDTANWNKKLDSYTETQNLDSVLTQGTSAGNKNITNLADPVNSQDAATKAYVTLSVSAIGDTLFLGSEQWVIISGISAANNTGDTSVANAPISVLFSVSSTKKVYFSSGNLQYQASTNTWRFAPTQYTIVGNAAGNTAPSALQSAWIDLFGWGTSGYNNKYPFMTSTTSADYGNDSTNISGTNYDWGVYIGNSISNGASSNWRTLTKDEWVYLIQTRANAVSKCGQATVNGVAGMVLLPDTCTLPAGCSFTSGYGSGFTTNSYSVSQWTLMENVGAVFLPAAGYRNGTSVGSVGVGNYWSSTCRNIGGAYKLYIGSSYVLPSDGDHRFFGYSVRLVQDF